MRLDVVLLILVHSWLTILRMNIIWLILVLSCTLRISLSVLVPVFFTSLVARHTSWWFTHEHGHLLKHNLQVILDLLFIGELFPLSLMLVLLTESLEVPLVVRSLVLKLALLFGLIVFDRQRLVINYEALLRRCGLIWSPKADEGVKLLLLTRWEHLEAFNLAKRLEEILELVFGHVVRKASDI